MSNEEQIAYRNGDPGRKGAERPGACARLHGATWFVTTSNG